MLGIFSNESVGVTFTADGKFAARNTKIGNGAAFSVAFRRFASLAPISSVTPANPGGRLFVATVAQVSAMAAAVQPAHQSAWLTDLSETAHSRTRYAHPASVIRSRYRTKVR